MKIATFFIVVFLLPFIAVSTSNAQALTPQWLKKASGSDSTALENITNIKTDNNGNSYALVKASEIINADGRLSFDTCQFALVSWDSNGVFRWMKSFGGSGSMKIDFIELSAVGEIYIYSTATLYSSQQYIFFDQDTTVMGSVSPHYCSFILKYNTNGQLMWFNTHYGSNVYNDNGSYGLRVSPSGDLYSLEKLNPGIYDGGTWNIVLKKIYLIRYSSGGVYQSSVALDMDLPDLDARWILDFPSNRLYVAINNLVTCTGLTIGNTIVPNSSSSMAVLAAFNLQGNAKWVRYASPNKRSTIIEPLITEDKVILIAGGSDPGTVYMGDTAFNSIGQKGSPYIMAVDTNGNMLWTKHAGTNYPSFTSLPDFSYGKNILTAVGDYNFNFNTVWYNHTLSGPVGMYVLRINAATGAFIYMDTIATPAFPNVCTIDKNSNVYVGGSFNKEMRAGNDTISNNNFFYRQDMFLLKLKLNPVSVINNMTTVAGIRIFPNPAKDVLTIQNNGTGVLMGIFNTQGVRCLHGTLTNKEQLISIKHLNPGVYYLRFVEKDGSSYSRSFIKE